MLLIERIYPSTRCNPDGIAICDSLAYQSIKLESVMQAQMWHYDKANESARVLKSQGLLRVRATTV